MFILILSKGIILNKLVIVLFHYNVWLYELLSENKVFIIIIMIIFLIIKNSEQVSLYIKMTTHRRFLLLWTFQNLEFKFLFLSHPMIQDEKRFWVSSPGFWSLYIESTYCSYDFVSPWLQYHWHIIPALKT